MSTDTIHIVNRGRGPQLSTSRITVQDVLPYYREGASAEEIQRWLPTLSRDEVSLLIAYIRDHLAEVLQKEAEIRDFHARERAMQPAWTQSHDHLSIEDRRARLRQEIQRRQLEPGSGEDPAR